MGAYWDMVPWLVFASADRQSGLSVGLSAVVAVGSSLAIVVVSYWRGRAAPMAWLSVIVFGGWSVVGLVFPPDVATTGVHIVAARALSFLVLSLALGASLLAKPLSVFYTRPLVRVGAEDVRFDLANRCITAVWALGSLGIAVSYGALHYEHRGYWLTLFAWLVPLVVGAGTVRWGGERWQAFVLGTLEEPYFAADTFLPGGELASPPARILSFRARPAARATGAAGVDAARAALGDGSGGTSPSHRGLSDGGSGEPLPPPAKTTPD